MLFFRKNTNKRHLLADYHKKTLENPFFKRKEKIMLLYGLKAKLLISAFFLIFCFASWFFLFSSFWKIKEIIVSGPNQTATEEIRKLAEAQVGKRFFLLRPQKNLLFFKTETLREKLKNEYRFQKIEINKEWPDKLTVSVIEKPLACIWNEADRYYYVDTDGYVLGEVNPLDIKEKKYPLVSNESMEMIRDAKIGIDPAIINFAAQLFKKFPAQALGTEIDRFSIDQEIDTVKIQTKDGIKIFFDAKGDAEKQLDKLLALKNQKLKDGFKDKKMIDLRFGDKIYYQ